MSFDMLVLIFSETLVRFVILRTFPAFASKSECWKEDNARMLAAQNWRGEVFGLDSRCFFANLTRQVCGNPDNSKCGFYGNLDLNFFLFSQFSSHWLRVQWRDAVTDISVLDPTVTRSRCGALDGSTVQLGAIQRYQKQKRMHAA